MSKAIESYIYSNNSEPKIPGSLPIVSGGSISIPLEALRSVADKSLVAHIEELTRNYNDLCREDERRARAYMRMGADLNDVREENERLVKELEVAKRNAGLPQNNFLPVIDCRKFINKHKQMPKKEWVVRFWNKMYELACQTDGIGIYTINCAEVLVPIYKVITESTSIPYNFIGSREDFEYHWNSNVVDRLEDEERAKKLTCKHKSLTTALSQPCWKDQAPYRWQSLSLEGTPFTKKYEKGVVIKKSIESFCK